MTWRDALPIFVLAFAALLGVLYAAIDYARTRRSEVLPDPDPSTSREAFRDSPRVSKL